MQYQCWVSLFEQGERADPTLQVETVVWNVGVYFSLPVKILFLFKLIGLPETLLVPMAERFCSSGLQ